MSVQIQGNVIQREGHFCYKGKELLFVHIIHCLFPPYTTKDQIQIREHGSFAQTLFRIIEFPKFLTWHIRHTNRMRTESATGLDILSCCFAMILSGRTSACALTVSIAGRGIAVICILHHEIWLSRISAAISVAVSILFQMNIPPEFAYYSSLYTLWGKCKNVTYYRMIETNTYKKSSKPDNFTALFICINLTNFLYFLHHTITVVLP